MMLQVVDARAGPGTKSIMKMKGKGKEDKQKKKHKHKKIKHNKPPNSPGGLSDDVVGKLICLWPYVVLKVIFTRTKYKAIVAELPSASRWP